MSSNRLSRIVGKIQQLPSALQSPALSLLFGSQVKFAGTAKVRVHTLTQQQGVMSIANKRKVQNHIKGVHAAAMALLAESATGFLVGMNVPDDKLPLIKSLKVDYLKRATGSLRAEASLTPEQIQAIHTQEKGEVLVAVTVTDEAGIQLIQCEMLWAWVSKKR
jgi:acyl-coenzyme A thioesterase PaaI-like protein